MYVAAILLLLQIARLSWMAIHLADAGRYLLHGHLLSAIGLVLIIVFLWRPLIGRWYVVPYLAFLGFATFIHVFDGKSLLLSASYIAGGLVYSVVSLILWRKLTEERTAFLPNKSADLTASAGTSAAGQPRVPPSAASHL